MALIPQLNTTASAIYRHYEATAEDGLREHLGASLIGHHCSRYLWLTFRWAKKAAHSGRLLRLFESGQREEGRIIGNLRAIGCEVSDATGDGKQHRVSAHGGHFAGSLDAIAQGFPEAHESWHVCEFKTSNTKDFKQIQERGVQDVKPLHYVQMNVYMGLKKYDRAMYIVVCKETDDIYCERVHFDSDCFSRHLDRAGKIINAAEPPERCSNDATWWQCKMCDYHAMCHGTEAPLPTCRTCAHSTPDTKSVEWLCRRSQDAIKFNPKLGCGDHRYIPILLRNFAEMEDANDEGNWVQYKNLATGKTFWNGDLSSHEIHSCQDKRMLGDEGLDHWRRSFDGSEVAA